MHNIYILENIDEKFPIESVFSISQISCLTVNADQIIIIIIIIIITKKNINSSSKGRTISYREWKWKNFLNNHTIDADEQNVYT